MWKCEGGVGFNMNMHKRPLQGWFFDVFWKSVWGSALWEQSQRKPLSVESLNLTLVPFYVGY
jgi:hypothetical protein